MLKREYEARHVCRTPAPRGAVGQLHACGCGQMFMLINKGNDGSNRPGKVWVRQ